MTKLDLERELRFRSLLDRGSRIHDMRSTPQEITLSGMYDRALKAVMNGMAAYQQDEPGGETAMLQAFDELENVVELAEGKRLN